MGVRRLGRESRLRVMRVSWLVMVRERFLGGRHAGERRGGSEAKESNEGQESLDLHFVSY